MSKIEKVNKFIEKNNIQETIYSLNEKLVNNSNQYPEDYYAFEEKTAFSCVYDIRRDSKKLVYQGNFDEAFTFFLIKAFFLDYCRNNNLDKEIYKQEEKEITCIDNVLYYKEYKYFTFPNRNVSIDEVERLNRRVCYLHMFLEDIIMVGLVERKVELAQILILLSK